MPEQIAISGKTRLVALLGNPTAHSLSPAIHNLSFSLLGIDARYLCFDVENENLGAVVAGLRALDRWDGCNLTMPCKQVVIPHLDGLDDAAQLIGAVNVLKKEADGTVRGYNTDGAGFTRNLAQHGAPVQGARMVLLGAGGAGRAVLAQAALDGAAHLDVFARAGGASHAAAADLIARVAAKTGCSIQLHDLNCEEDLQACIAAADILANTTPVGMGEGCEDTLVPADWMTPNLAVADAIYHPRKTRLVRDAEARGCTAVPGLGMLIQQAAAGELIWYNAEMPIDAIETQLFS